MSMNQLSESSMDITRSMHDELERFFPQPVHVLTRRRTSLGLQPANRHFTYHQWMDRVLPARPRYVGEEMKKAICHIFPSNSPLVETEFARLFRDYLNKDRTILEHFPAAAVQQMCIQYDIYLRTLTDAVPPVDYETVFQVVVRYLEHPVSSLPQSVMFIPDYEVLLGLPQKNHNAIMFVETLIRWYVEHDRPIFTLYCGRLRHHHQGGATDYATVNHFIKACHRAF